MGRTTETTEENTYLSGKEAASYAGVDARTIYRWVEDGKLFARHPKKGVLLIARADLEAFVKENPSKKKQSSPHSDSTDVESRLRAEMQEIRVQMQEVHDHVQELLTLKDKLYLLVEQVNGLLSILNAQDTNQAEDQDHPAGSPSRLANLYPFLRLVRSTTIASSAIERRKLPDHTMAVVEFAKVHAVSLHRDIKKLYKMQLIDLHIIQRPTAERNGHEWWITPTQQHQLIRYWQDHEIPYATCPHCPHEIQQVDAS